MKVSSFNTHQRLLHGIIRPAEGEEDNIIHKHAMGASHEQESKDGTGFTTIIFFMWTTAKNTINVKLTFHVEVAVEIGRPVSIEQSHPAVMNLFISVHQAIVLIIAVGILEHHTQ